MLNRRCRITCSIRASVTLGDLSVSLRGLGDSTVVLRSTADRSEDLRRAKDNGWVKVSPVMPVRVWPFVPSAGGLRPEPPPAPPPAPVPVPETLRTGEMPREDPTLKVLSSIDKKLGQLLARPAPAPPEVVAAALRGLGTMQEVPAGLPGGPRIPGPGAASHPQFIPSRIVPQEGVEARVKTSESEVEHDVEGGVEALKKLRRKKT